MRYTLFVEAEGVLTQSTQKMWATLENGIVVDASISARNQGIKVGMGEKTARALLPQIVFYSPALPKDTVMHMVRELVESYTPWVQWIGRQRFYAQIPVTQSASKEIRELILSLHQLLSSEQRIRVGLAECKEAARALVEWSRYGTIPGAGLFVIKQQQLIVSPSMVQLEAENNACSWLKPFPMNAMWMLPKSIREELQALGVLTFGQLLEIPDKDLKARFGKEIGFLKQHLFRVEERIPALSEHVPKTCAETWRAPAGEFALASHLFALAQTLLKTILLKMVKFGLGAQQIELNWETDLETSQFSRTLKEPVSTEEVLWPQVLPALEQFRGNQIYCLQIKLKDLSYMQGRQLSFTVSENRILPAQQKAVKQMNQVLAHVNQKFPEKLRCGLKAGFRELRLEALGEW